jgi:hypothetical protein
MQQFNFASQHAYMTARVPPLAPLAVGALLLAAVIRPAAAADVVEMSFEGFGPAGLHVVNTHTVIEEAPAWYEIQGDFATAGLGAVFSNVANTSLARGSQKQDAPHPELFESETQRNGAVVRNRVDFRDGTPNGTSTPVPTEPVTPIDPRQLPGTVDNLTAYLLLERQIARGGSCALKVPVFDGRHRYDLEFSDAGQTVLKPEAGQKFSGPAHECRMARDKIGGFYVDKKHEEGAHAGVIWYAPLLPEGDLAVPVRMEMQTEIGEVEIYLSRLLGRGVDLRLME